MNPEPQSTKKGGRLNALIVIPAVVGFIFLLVIVVVLLYLNGTFNPPEQQIARIEAGNPAFDYQATPPRVDAKALAATQEVLLHSYAWVDQSASVARIPVDRAMELVPTTMIEYAQQVTAVPPAPAATTESGDEIARPSNPGGAGQAVNLTGDAATGSELFVENCQLCHGPTGQGGVPNPGSDDGTVPPLNPIDDTLISADPYIYAYNVDLFIEHGSDAEGPNPEIAMPAWGDEGRLAPQQIADLIAYIESLNPAPSAAMSTDQPSATQPASS